MGEEASDVRIAGMMEAKRVVDEHGERSKLFEGQYRRAAKLLTGADWRTRVGEIKNRIVRIQAACIVWWDYFGGRSPAREWHDLDDYRDAWRVDHNVEKTAVWMALREIGYPEYLATARLKMGDE